MENRFETARWTPGVQYTFRFETHAAPPDKYEDKQETMRQLMRATFHKGQTNILFRESMYGTEEQELWYGNQLKVYGSHVMAELSTMLKVSEGKNPNRQDIESCMTVIDRNKVNDPVYAYKMLTAEVLDELVADGITIRTVLEKTLNLKSKYPNPPAFDAHDPLIMLLKNREQRIEHVRENVVKGVQFRKDRDDIIKKQLEELQRSVGNTGKPVNVLVLMGVLHSNLFSSLPFKTKAVSTASSEPYHLGYPPDAYKRFRADAGLDFDAEELLAA